jgi:hypothetical protein
MSTDLILGNAGPVTKTYATKPEGFRVGQRRFEGGKEYVFTQADDAIGTAGMSCKPDATDGSKVTPTAAATDGFSGISEVVVADEAYFWLTVRGSNVQALVADSTSAGAILAPSGTSGTLAIAPTSTAIRQGRGILNAGNSSGAAAVRSIELV